MRVQRIVVRIAPYLNHVPGHYDPLITITDEPAGVGTSPIPVRPTLQLHIAVGAVRGYPQYHKVGHEDLWAGEGFGSKIQAVSVPVSGNDQPIWEKADCSATTDRDAELLRARHGVNAHHPVPAIWRPAVVV